MLGELSSEQIEHLLHREVVGRIGCHANGKTYVVPVNYAYDGVYLYGHAADGMKLRMLRANSEVCFQVDQRSGLSEWQSVIAWGTFEELHGDEASRAVDLLLDRLLPLLASEGAATTPEQARETLAAGAPVEQLAIYRIRLHERTGRFETHAGARSDKP
jgi:nitroimidazol reductase NimA-like FMN-containing flavoprotein (pyridoxamine 5'-phosphate oxidase superfamily)